MGLSQMANKQADQAGAAQVEQVGIFLSYQVALTESHTVALHLLTAFQNQSKKLSKFPLTDTVFWARLKQKMLSYYFERFIKFASAKLRWNLSGKQQWRLLSLVHSYIWLIILSTVSCKNHLF